MQKIWAGPGCRFEIGMTWKERKGYVCSSTPASFRSIIYIRRHYTRRYNSSTVPLDCIYGTEGAGRKNRWYLFPMCTEDWTVQRTEENEICLGEFFKSFTFYSNFFHSESESKSTCAFAIMTSRGFVKLSSRCSRNPRSWISLFKAHSASMQFSRVRKVILQSNLRRWSVKQFFVRPETVGYRLKWYWVEMCDDFSSHASSKCFGLAVVWWFNQIITEFLPLKAVWGHDYSGI